MHNSPDTLHPNVALTFYVFLLDKPFDHPKLHVSVLFSYMFRGVTKIRAKKKNRHLTGVSQPEGGLKVEEMDTS